MRRGLPDFSTPLSRIAGSVEKIADAEDSAPGASADELSAGQAAATTDRTEPATRQPNARSKEEAGSHA